ncbi:MAG: hypothetical protein CMP91_01195 [Gammaproteobacteria bacterium]|nr:hypothetical protein [Gammaproteobacteria bacterium]MAY03036.1 hypothetical protein [Gammaproteobacteria bacterium]|tara:strand:+ start:480798 stop:481550 length:753 start_codon:yes stop_codon:yes gene_type:complete
MTNFDAYWNAWAPYWHHVEDFFFEEDSLNAITDQLQPPVLVLGAGLGLIVEALRKNGIECDGLDLSQPMLEQAKQRRNLDLILGDAADMPFADNSYQSCISASGVIDFMGDEALIARIINEMKRVTIDANKIFIAFGHFSPAMEQACREMDVIKDMQLHIRHSLRLSAAMAAMSLEELAQQPSVGTEKEQKFGMGYYKIFNEVEDPQQLIDVAPETQYYRTEEEVKALFKRLGLPIREFTVAETSYIVRI